eukprot:8176885-Heterocapsa_arctica.AAC.1
MADFSVDRNNPDSMWHESTPLPNSMVPTHLSFFAGLGSWTVATEASRGTTKMAADNDERMVHIHAAYHPNTDIRRADINDLSKAE